MPSTGDLNAQHWRLKRPALETLITSIFVAVTSIFTTAISIFIVAISVAG